MERTMEERNEVDLAVNSMEIEGFPVSPEIAAKAAAIAKENWESGETQRRFKEAQKRHDDKQAHDDAAKVSKAA